ncbi:MAG: c-type cytochrome biogenesis protein CcmI [Burkholderiales bacterium]
MGFAAIAAVLVMVALVIVLRPLLGRRTTTAVTRDLANRDVYRDQFLELERDVAAGVLGAGQFERARAELQRRMLEDLSVPAGPAHSAAGRGTLAATAAGISVLAVVLYLHLGNPDGIGVQPPPADDAASVSPQQFEALTAQLAERLQAQPKDAQGWMMLGRAYRAMDKSVEAAAAYRKAVELEPRDVNLLADLAEAVATAQNRSLQGEPAELLKRALALDPANPKALALAGSAAFERKDYRTAIRHWEQLLKTPDLGEPMKLAIADGIARARVAEQAAKPSVSASVGKDKSSSSSPGSAAGLRGVVSLHGSLSAKVKPDDVVFVFARAAQGPRMPLAVVRIAARDLPYQFMLDDSMAMTPQMKLSGFEQVVVGARVSRTGTPTPSPGDLEGLSSTVAPGASGVNVLIDRTVN